MVRGRFFAHVCRGRQQLKSRVRPAKYLNRSVRDPSLGKPSRGVGLALDAGPIVRGWMHSPGHRDAILDDSFRGAGVGVAPGAPKNVRRRAATCTTVLGYRVTIE